MKWTKEQKSAIEDDGGTLLVSAAAGSGKTAVLVERAVRLLLDESKPVSADRLLIVTFTRAAAEELRARIALRLTQEQALAPRSMYIRKQRLLLGRANISTVDSFCMQLLKQYFTRANLPADFDMANEAEMMSIKQNTLSAVLEEMYNDADFCEFASMYGRSRSDATAQKALLSIYEYLESMPFPNVALKQLCDDWENDKPLVDTKWGKLLLNEALSIISSALALENTALTTVLSEEALAPYTQALQDDIAYLSAMQELTRLRQWDTAAEKARAFKPSTLKAVKGYEGTLVDAIKALRNKAKTLAARLEKEIFVCTMAEFNADRLRTAPILRSLARGAERLSKELLAEKLAQKSLEFSDLEHLALQLLCNDDKTRTELSYKVAAGFDAIMVDEFQDTNELQSILYSGLANENESNLFLVGDIKQSVYRFRLAQPEIFLSKKDSFYRYETQCHPAVLTLGANFRSSRNIIDEVNYVFSVIMSRRLGGVDYNDDERLYVGTSDEFDGGAMQLTLVDTPMGVSAGDAEYIAEAINNMVHNGYKVREKSGGERACTYGDFCILLRTRGNFALYSAELEAHGIPVYTDSGESLLTLPEVSVLLSMLRVIDNPVQDIHMAAVLLSILYSFTPSELVDLRIKWQKGSLYSALLQDNSEKSRHFCADLATFRRLVASVSIEELFTEIFARTKYFEAIGAAKCGSEKRDNVRAFVEYANNSCKGAGGLSGFLRVLETAGDKVRCSAADAPAVPANTVSIMTIHRSKGLEFPICVLADANHGFNLRDASEPLLTHAHLGAAITLNEGENVLYRTAPHRAIGIAMRSEAVSEEMRILYVALTRARDKLIITVPMQKPEKKLSDIAVTLAGTNGANATILSGADSYAEWLCTAALLHPDCDNLRSAAGGILLPIIETESHISAEIVQYSEEKFDDLTTVKNDKAPIDERLCNELCEGFERERSIMRQRIDIPTKVSVSSLTHSSKEVILEKPSFAYADGRTGAQKGTALHSFMQYADFMVAKGNLTKELTRLVSMQYITQELADSLDKAAIEQFLSSNLSNRILHCDKMLREYDFITSVPPDVAIEATEEQLQNAAPVLVQGIADAVLINGDTAEIIDYKTDRVSSPQILISRYKKQLLLYSEAIAKRLNVKVTALTIYSFALNCEIPLF